MSKQQRFTMILFYLCFVALLLVSLPKVAWVFHAFEEQQNIIINLVIIQIDMYWFISYGIALSIDVLILWLSYVASNSKNKVSKATWAFIIGLSLLSMYCNYLYNINFKPIQSGVWSNTILGIGVSFITPIIVSSVPLFILCYTFMLNKVTSSKLTVEELRELADRLEQEKIQRDRIADINKGKATSTVNNALTSIADIAKHAKRQFRAIGENEVPIVDIQDVHSIEGIPDIVIAPSNGYQSEITGISSLINKWNNK